MTRPIQLILSLLALSVGFTSASGDNEYQFDDDFFTFNDDTLWSDYALMPKRCINL